MNAGFLVELWCCAWLLCLSESLSTFEEADDKFMENACFNTPVFED